jgi:hypothetical protein
VKLVLKKKTAEKIGLRSFVQFGVMSDSWTYRDTAEIDLVEIPRKLDALQALLSEHKSIHGIGVLLKDLAMWRLSLKDTGAAKARTVKQFESLVTNYLKGVEGHRIYLRESEDVWLPYFVGEVEYREKVVHNHSTTPEHVTVVLHCERFGHRRCRRESFYEEDCRGMTVVESLSRQNFFAETPDLRAAHTAEMERYRSIASVLGAQFWAHGIATTDVDGNPRTYVEELQMVREGQRTRVVVDVFYEDPSTERDSDRYVIAWFWANGEETEEQPEIDIPVHPYLAIFDMSKHTRLRAHIGYLTPYEYAGDLDEKLILPSPMKALVRMLIERKAGAFQDIVKGKAGGAVILLAGPPGVGKTLTAEVYAESEQRALYSVQCSQLGTKADELEDELVKVFARAARWRAVLLLDEADVYVHERGRDLQQNAIVGVFLRVLEYQDTVLFLTTNRPDDVDDAIASRCVARLSYPRPSALEQKQIWRVLATAANARITDSTIEMLVERNSELSGRDIKNLLKLALLMEPEKELTLANVEFVKQFQPTVK